MCGKNRIKKDSLSEIVEHGVLDEGLGGAWAVLRRLLGVTWLQGTSWLSVVYLLGGSWAFFGGSLGILAVRGSGCHAKIEPSRYLNLIYHGFYVNVVSKPKASISIVFLFYQF